MHLDPEKSEALLQGKLPPDEARALSSHLAGECEDCERLLATGASVDPLDGVTDAAVARALPPKAGEGNDLEFARILRAVGSRRRAARRELIAGALAASLLVAGVAGILVGRPDGLPLAAPGWDGVKGAAPRAIPVRLRFLVVDAAGEIEKGISGERVRFSSRLIFEVEAGRPANAALARVSPAAGVEVIWRQRVRSGRTQVALGGRPAAYPLASLSGPHRFVLLASEAPLGDSRLEEAAAALAPPAPPSADAPAVDGLSLDLFDVYVQ